MGVHRSGLTLAEAIVSIFVMLAGVVVMVRLFHTGIRYQTLVDNQSTAVMLAEREMERVRGWSRKNHTSPPSTLDFNNFLAENYPGRTPYQDSDFPGFEVKTVATAIKIYSPCSLFEELYPVSQQRVIGSSLRKVTVTVSWGYDRTNTSTRRLTHQLTSLVGLPTGEKAALVDVDFIGSTSVSKDDIRNVKVTATNPEGQAMPDLFYNYIVQSGLGDLGGGFGSVDDTRDGRTAALRNVIYDAQTPPAPSGYGYGRCDLRCRALYRGYPSEGVEKDIDMLP